MAKILLVVSEADRVSSISHSTWEGKEEVSIVENGEVAWNMIQANPPDILFVEDMVPGMTGLELLWSIFNEPKLSLIKIILGMHVGSNGTPFRTWERSIDSYLIAPYSSWQIILNIEQLLYRTIQPNPKGLENWNADKFAFPKT